MSAIPPIVFYALRRHPQHDGLYHVLLQTIEWAHAVFTNDYSFPGLRYRIRMPQALSVEFRLYSDYVRTGNARSEWYETIIGQAVALHDHAFFAVFLNESLPVAGIDFHQPFAVLDALRSIFSVEDRTIQRLLESFLAQLHLYYPDTVDVFMKDMQASPEMRVRIRTNKPTESISQLIGERLFVYLIERVILGSPT